MLQLKSSKKKSKWWSFWETSCKSLSQCHIFDNSFDGLKKIIIFPSVPENLQVYSVYSDYKPAHTLCKAETHIMVVTIAIMSVLLSQSNQIVPLHSCSGKRKQCGFCSLNLQRKAAEKINVFKLVVHPNLIHPLCRWLPQVFNLAISFPPFLVVTDFPPVTGLLGAGRRDYSAEHFNRKALRLMAVKRFLCKPLLPTSPSWMAVCNGYIFSLSKVLSALFSCEMTIGVCGWKLPQKGSAFLSMGPLWASRDQIDSVGRFHSCVEEIILGYRYPSKYVMSLSFLLLPGY